MAHHIVTAPRPPTIRDVAHLAGVSTATVSRILSGALEARPETRARVLAAVHELAYRPSGIARSLKLRTTGTFGLIVTDIANPFFPELVRAIEDAAREGGYMVLLGNAAEDPGREAAYLDLLSERRIDGLIVASSGLTERHGRSLAGALVPIVLANCELGDGLRPAVLTDNRAAAALGAEHLLALGHRRLGHIAGRATNAATAERLAGIGAALARAGLAVDDLAIAGSDGHIGGGERAMRELLARQPRPTGVCCYNDLTAIGAIRAIREAGLRVPDDVSVVGFDDIDLAADTHPPLTTVAQDIGRIGRYAVEWLIEIVTASAPGGGVLEAGEPFVARTVRLPATLRIRESTAPPPAST